MAGVGKRIARRADQGAAEGQHAIAVARRPFAEQHDRVAFGQALRDLGIDVVRLVAARAIDEDRALQPREQPHQRPARDFLLGDEPHRGDRRDDRNIEP